MEFRQTRALKFYNNIIIFSTRKGGIQMEQLIQKLIAFMRKHNPRRKMEPLQIQETIFKFLDAYGIHVKEVYRGNQPTHIPTVSKLASNYSIGVNGINPYSCLKQFLLGITIICFGDKIIKLYGRSGCSIFLQYPQIPYYYNELLSVCIS